MELFYKFRDYLARSSLLAILLYFVAHYSGLTQSHTGLFRLLSTLVAFTIIAIYDVLLYPAFFSPLRKLPVVYLSDVRYVIPITDVPRGDIALQWVKQHPDSDAICIRLGFQTLVAAISPNALRDVLGTHQSDYVKPNAGKNYLSRILGYGLILSEGSVHARQRKTLTSSFRIQNIRALHDLMLAKTKLMISGMETQMSRSGSCEMNSWGSKVTLDIIGNSLMSQEFDSLRTERQPINEAFSELTAVSSGQTRLFLLSTILPKALVSLIPTPTNMMIHRNSRIIRAACDEALRSRDDNSRKASTGSEILSTLLSDPEASRQEVIDQMLTFLGAGHETTATSVAWATHLLTLPENSKYQELLREEICAKPECIDSAAALETMPWLNAILEETMRLYPPVTNTARLSIRDTTVAGTRIPKGTVVTLFPWAVNRHPRHWGGEEMAERFAPERWLDGVENGQPRFNKHGGARSNYCEMTFLHGNRACIGKDFSKAELRCILACIFGQFRVTRRPGDGLVAEPAGSITIKPKGGLYVCLERVNTF